MSRSPGSWSVNNIHETRGANGRGQSLLKYPISSLFSTALRIDAVGLSHRVRTTMEIRVAKTSIALGSGSANTSRGS